MNHRNYAILYDLINNHSSVINEYAYKFNVSNKTIRNDIKNINLELMQLNHPQILINDNGDIYFDTNKKINMDAILTLIRESNYYTYHLTPEERKTILAIKLLNSKGYITITELSDDLLVSRNTMISDLDELKDWFKKNNIKLNSYPRKGYKLAGTEREIRNAMIQLFLMNSDMIIFNDENQSILSKFLLEEINDNNKINDIVKIIREIEKKYNVRFTSFSYRKVVYSLLVMINRIICGNYIKKTSKNYEEKINQNSKYKMAMDLLNKLIDKFSFKFMSSELENIIDILSCQSYIKNNEKSIDMIDSQILINEFIYNVSKELNINYYLDFYLYDLLISHMKSAINRAKQGRYVENPLNDQIINIYPYVYNIIKDNIYIIENNLNINFNSDELSFITMYIMSILEKNNLKDTNIKVIICCTTGQCTAQLLAVRLQMFCKQVEIYDIVSPHNLEDLNINKFDLIISTIPLSYQKKPWIQVNALLPESDLYKVQNIITKLQTEKIKQIPSSKNIICDDYKINIFSESGAERKFVDLFDEKRIKLDVDVNNWEESVREAGKLLYEDNIITLDYIDSMIKIIKKNGPYVVIYPGIAIPHANPKDGALKVGASLIGLKNPINFDHKKNDPVKFVIALSVKDSKINKSLYSLTKLLKAGNFIENLSKANTSQEIIKIINDCENNI